MATVSCSEETISQTQGPYFIRQLSFVTSAITLQQTCVVSCMNYHAISKPTATNSHQIQ